ncbi:MAG: hypothetical protein L6R35_004749 [Caloplaca aegaea]|nr:MAG: hypothetical protein L6R35_004749 [Caloplaca aegaea]
MQQTQKMNASDTSLDKKPAKFDDIDKRLERLERHILPDAPYLMDLTTPSRYHVAPNQANNWRRACPFDKHEEQLQYMTFLPHTLRGDTMFRTTGDWDDGHGKMKVLSSKPISGGSSGAISPPGQQPKKKISLLDYKNKLAGQTSGKTTPKATDSEKQGTSALPPSFGQTKKTTANSEVQEKTVEITNSASQKPKGEAPHGQKRSADAMAEHKDPKIFDDPPALPPSKRPKIVADDHQTATLSKSEDCNMHGLPRMLSPTLPPNVEEQLAQLRGGNAQLKNKVGAAMAAESRAKPAVNGHVTSGKTGPKPDGKSQSSSVSDSRITQHDRQHLLVRLKIPKSLRKNCQRILQMQSRPRKLPNQSVTIPSSGPRDRSTERPMTNGGTSRQVQQNSGTNGDGKGRGEAISKPKAVVSGIGTPKPGEKRRQPEDNKESSQTSIPPSSKRQRLSAGDLQRPTTPATSTVRSPNVPQPSNSQRSQLSTPKNSLKSAAMQRIGSTDGDTQTPLGSMRINTPTAPDSVERSSNRDGRSSSNVSLASATNGVGPTDEGARFKAEFNKYADMARSLKRGADTLAKSNDGQVSTNPVARKEGLAVAIETTLCYMLAFTLKDESDRIKRLPSERAAWVSLLPYFRFLKSLLHDDDSPYLLGFLYQLEAVCRETILQHDFERLERDVNATDEDFTTFRKQMAENRKMGMQCWIEGSNLLSLTDIEEQYPRTWNKQSKEPFSSRGKEKLILKRYGEGGYHLPLCLIASSIEAVRLGWVLLREWCEKEGVKWDGKMNL